MTQKDRKTPPLTVLDVSRWQGRIDWDAVQRSGKIDGVMLRVLGSKNGKSWKRIWTATRTPSRP